MNINTPKYWDNRFEEEYKLLKTEHHSNQALGYRWCGVRFGLVSAYIPFKGNLLEIGCGLGNFCRYMKARNPELEIVGTDFSPKAIELASKIEPNIEYIEAEAHKLPFEDDTFNIVVSQEIIEHIDNPEGAIKEWKRVLKKGGELYITTPWKGVGQKKFGNRFHGLSSDEHVQEWGPKEFSDMCAKIFKKNIKVVFPPAFTDIISKKTETPYWFMVVCQK